ncbi:hypothetical protein MTR_5g081610 [Medicago truncatula]|uniref:Uncharacterized protein n=1 Tax=Medicago truncatula TaxID=3880 RepID=G7KBU6_MEDTR|nr:hypothetical protein MTR_5g081610 [Medicago truncatula]
MALLEPEEIAQGQVAWGPWQTRSGYASWFYCVSRPVINHLVEVVEEPPPRPPNHEVIIQEQYARELPTHSRSCGTSTTLPRRILEEMYPVTELQIVRRRKRRDGRRESQSSKEDG